jgi:hypothetical protein
MCTALFFPRRSILQSLELLQVEYMKFHVFTFLQIQPIITTLFKQNIIFYIIIIIIIIIIIKVWQANFWTGLNLF